MQIIENYKNLCDTAGRIFVEYDEIQELISKSPLQNDEWGNTKDTHPTREGLQLLNRTDKVQDYSREKTIG